MKLILRICTLFFISYSLLLTSCEEEDPAIPLEADAGEDQTAAVFETVVLDGSASSGPGGFRYEWGYVNGPTPENELEFFNVNVAQTTFVPKKNGEYTFKLRITMNDKFDEVTTKVTVTGFIELKGTLGENLVLKDIEPDGSKPDYKVTADFVIPATIQMQYESGNVVIEIADNVGIEVQGGSINLSSSNTVEFMSLTGWKGFLVNGGSLTLSGATAIRNGGKSAFTGQSEAATITVVNNGNLNISGATFSGSFSYDILLGSASSSSIIQNNSFSFSTPIKAGITNLNCISYNNYPGYDYIHITTPGAGTTVGNGNTNFNFANAQYFIDGDFTSGGRINTSGGAIYMKAGTGILTPAITASNTQFDGLNSADWKGIAVTGFNTSTFSNVTISHAGSEVFNTGAYQSDAKAAIYCTNTGSTTVQSSQIVDSKGYGIYSTSFGIVRTTSTTFTNSALAAMRVPAEFLATALPSSHGNTFVMSGGLPAVELQSATNMSTSQWGSLGTGNHYLMSGNLVLNSVALTLMPGVTLKFKAGRSLTTLNGGRIIAIGDASNAITLDSETGAAGSWLGMVLDGVFNLEYCQIKNGGESLMSGATEKANVVVKYTGVTNSTNYTFKNNNVTGSGGFGVVVEAGGKNPGITDGANANTYSANVSANTLIK